MTMEQAMGEWLARNPLTVTALEEEVEEWNATQYRLDIRTLREAETPTEAQAA